MYRTARKSYEPYYERILEDFSDHDIKNILCVGARDSSEVFFFREKGLNAIGIDLFSADQSTIKVLDMHMMGETFGENEFDIVFACHSLEHSANPEKVLHGMKKISKHGAFIVLPLCESPHKKDPVVFDFMEKAGDDGDTPVSHEDVERDFKAILGDQCYIKNFSQLPLLPNIDDGFWFSIFWGK
tara:strand:+ start:414 stop:968 length:555 start_codon:yes stop_codon:yes gene_type:complete